MALLWSDGLMVWPGGRVVVWRSDGVVFLCCGRLETWWHGDVATMAEWYSVALAARCQGGLAVWWSGSVAVWLSGCLVVWCCGGLETWWHGGVAPQLWRSGTLMLWRPGALAVWGSSVVADLRTMVQNYPMLRHLIIHFPTSSKVSE